MQKITEEEVFNLHKGGKISTKANTKVNNKRDLATVYTPNVAKVCTAIAKNQDLAKEYTIKKNTVCVLSDGSAVLGLGNLGAAGAIPVMEGKAMLFKSQANINAFPICVDTQDTEEIIKIAKSIAPVFGGINLEDISAPRCFEIEKRLENELDIPVFHDDQHGTAIVSLAALLNALKLINKKIEDVKVVVSGAGAAGIACTKLWLRAGILPKNIVVCDRSGAIFDGRIEHMNDAKMAIGRVTNSNKISGSIKEVVKNADVFLGVSGANVIDRQDVINMNKNAIIFALSNPNPEIVPETINDLDVIIATGRSDFPNQINNLLCFPGLFKGLLDNDIKQVTPQIKLNCAKAIANLIDKKELKKDYIIPDALDKRVVEVVANSVKTD